MNCCSNSPSRSGYYAALEKVQFNSDRRVARTSAIELKIPQEAPVLVTEDLEPHWLVPLSVMRRKTLVNLDLKDEEGRSISSARRAFHSGGRRVDAARRR